jgi:AP2 domain.
MPKLPVTKKKEIVCYAEVDDCFFGELARYKWGLARRYVRRGEGTRPNFRHIYLHQQVMDLGGVIKIPKAETDHINRDPLDNRLCNLRYVSKRQNQANSQGKRGSARYKGVAFHKLSGKYQANIIVAGKQVYLGLFLSAKDAALAYNKRAFETHGEYAFLNEVGGESQKA